MGREPEKKNENKPTFPNAEVLICLSDSLDLDEDLVLGKKFDSIEQWHPQIIFTIKVRDTLRERLPTSKRQNRVEPPFGKLHTAVEFAVHDEKG
jgi:hypothetical protein